MKSPIKIILGTAALIFSMQVKADAPVSRDVVIALNDVFIPGGFDSTTDAYVIVSGIFPNGCYKWKGAEKKDINAFEHEVTSTATVNQGMCIQVLVPFSKDVRMGRLQAGQHILRFMSNDGTYIEKTLAIE
ncbi:MAG: hypothetical protein H7061_06255 [Bdellovibrionaceae bacterium]|nr:hypothetical protein [Bdellovibrio sp.]